MHDRLLVPGQTHVAIVRRCKPLHFLISSTLKQFFPVLACKFTSQRVDQTSALGLIDKNLLIRASARRFCFADHLPWIVMVQRSMKGFLATSLYLLNGPGTLGFMFGGAIILCRTAGCCVIVAALALLASFDNRLFFNFGTAGILSPVSKYIK